MAAVLRYAGGCCCCCCCCIAPGDIGDHDLVQGPDEACCAPGSPNDW
jgi:hypothetical protein